LAKPLGIENKGDCSIPDETQEEGFRGKILRIPKKMKRDTEILQHKSLFRYHFLIPLLAE
jgi:hypothetical protein